MLILFNAIYSNGEKSSNDLPILKTVEQEIFPTSSREPEVFTLASMLLAARPTTDVSTGLNKPMTRAISGRDRYTHGPYPNSSGHSLEIQQLQSIIDHACQSKSTVERQYGEDLARSLVALQLHIRCTPRLQQKLVDPGLLSAAISQAHLDIENRLRYIHEMLESNRSGHAYWQKQGTLWPSIMPVPILEALRSVSKDTLSHEMRNILINFALSIASLQRLLRIDAAFQKGHWERLAEETENEGHSNWDPSQYPDCRYWGSPYLPFVTVPHCFMNFTDLF